MAVAKIYNTGTLQWEPVLVGKQGPIGPQGSFNLAQTVETKSSNYSISSADAGKLIMNSAAKTITIEDELSDGQQIDFLQNSIDQITFVAGSGVTLSSASGFMKTSVKYSPVSVKCIAAGEYVLLGDLDQ